MKDGSLEKKEEISVEEHGIGCQAGDGRKREMGQGKKTGEIRETRDGAGEKDRRDRREERQERWARSKTIINHLPFLSSTTSSP